MQHQIGGELAIDVEAELVGGPGRIIGPKDIAFEDGGHVLPNVGRNHALGLDGYPAVAAVGPLDVEQQGKLVKAALLEGEVVWVKAVAGISSEKDLFDDALFGSNPERVDIRVGLEERPNPAFDAKAVGELEIVRVAQFHFAGDVGSAIAAVAEHAGEEQTVGADQAGGGIGGAIDEGAIVASNQIRGALAQRVQVAIPPTGRARTADGIVELIPMARRDRQLALDGPGRQGNKVAAYGPTVGVGHHGDRRIVHKPVALTDGRIIRAAGKDRHEVKNASHCILKAVREDQHGREIRDEIRRGSELDWHRRDVRVVGEVKQAVEEIRHQRRQDKIIQGGAGTADGPNNDLRQIGHRPIGACSQQRVGEVNGVDFPLRAGDRPIGAIDEIRGQDAGQLHYGGDRTNQDIGVILAAVAGVGDRRNLAIAQRAFIKAEFVQAALERYGVGEGGRRVITEIKITRGPRDEGGAWKDLRNSQGSIGKQPRRHRSRVVGQGHVLPRRVGRRGSVGNGQCRCIDSVRLGVYVPEVG